MLLLFIVPLLNPQPAYTHRVQHWFHNFVMQSRGWKMIAFMCLLLALAFCILLIPHAVHVVAPDLDPRNQKDFAFPWPFYLFFRLIAGLLLAVLVRNFLRLEKVTPENYFRLRLKYSLLMRLFLNCLLAILFVLWSVIEIASLGGIMNIHGSPKLPIVINDVLWSAGGVVSDPVVIIMFAVLIGATLPLFHGWEALQEVRTRLWLTTAGVIPPHYEMFIEDCVRYGLLIRHRDGLPPQGDRLSQDADQRDRYDFDPPEVGAFLSDQHRRNNQMTI